MESRPLAFWLLGAAAAAAAAILGIRAGGGTVDGTAPRPIAVPDGTLRRGLPPPRLPGGLAPAAEEAIRAAWPAVESGTPAEAAAALATLTPVAAGSPLMSSAPAALPVLSPALEILITGRDEVVATAAMRCAAALTRAGGAEGRAALGRSGLLERAFARNALGGSPVLQAETASLLGFAGGDRAQELLVVLLGKGKPAGVRSAAAAGLAEAFPLDHRLRPDAVEAVRSGAGPGEPPAVRRACIRCMGRAWEAFRPYDPGPLVAEALAAGDGGLSLAAAAFFNEHPLPAQGGDLLRAVPAAGPEVLALLADTLAILRPEGWREALEKRLPDLEDPSAVRKALGR